MITPLLLFQPPVTIASIFKLNSYYTPISSGSRKSLHTSIIIYFQHSCESEGILYCITSLVLSYLQYYSIYWISLSHYICYLVYLLTTSFPDQNIKFWNAVLFITFSLVNIIYSELTPYGYTVFFINNLMTGLTITYDYIHYFYPHKAIPVLFILSHIIFTLYRIWACYAIIHLSPTYFLLSVATCIPQLSIVKELVK